MQVRDVPGGQELAGKSGSVVITAPVPGVIVVRMMGHVSGDLVPAQIALLDRLRTGTPTDFFYDLWDMSFYDSAVRVEHTNWHLRDRSNLQSLHTMAQSKLVKMGVTVANVALGVITQHKNRVAFEAALERTVAAHEEHARL